jgi:hypothetical protein
MVDVRVIARASCPKVLEIHLRHPEHRQAALFFKSREAPERPEKSAKL